MPSDVFRFWQMMQSVLMQGSVDDRSDLVEQAVSVCKDGSFGIDVGLPMLFLIIIESLL